MIQSIQQKNIDLSQIKGIGITNQRETVLIWDKETGIPVYNAIVWQDRRTNSYCDKLKEDKELINKVKEKTGLLLDPYFSATKIKWLLDNVEGLRERAKKGEVLAGTIDTWLIWKLTNGKSHYTDYTNASRTLLFNIVSLEWDQELLDLFDIPISILPEVLNSADEYGKIEIEPLKGLQIYSAIGDQQSSLFGHRCKKGEIKSTYGTGAFLMLNTGNNIIKSKNGLLTTIALSIDGKISYALEGSIYMAGSVLKWLKEEMHLIQEYDQIDYYLNGDWNTKGVTVVPYFVGVGAPYWNSSVRGMITGITRGTNRRHVVRSASQSIPLQVKDILRSFESDYGQRIKKMSIDGGVSKSQELMQFSSDILDIKLIHPSSNEITGLGAAYLAGIKIKFWKDEDELNNLLDVKRIYYPAMFDEERDLIYNKWTKAVKAALIWNEYE